MASEERDFVIARASVARSAASGAVEGLDELVMLFRDPEEDPSGKERKDLLEVIIDSLDQSYVAVNAALRTLDQIDPSEGEPDLSFLEDDEDGEEDGGEGGGE